MEGWCTGRFKARSEREVLDFGDEKATMLKKVQFQIKASQQTVNKKSPYLSFSTVDSMSFLL